VPIEKPADYRREDYASLVDDIRQNRVPAPPETPRREQAWDGIGRVVNMVTLPNHKTDANNQHAALLSTDLPEENWPWPTASWEWRDCYAKRLRDYTLGLLWFVQNDPELPEDFRTRSRAWGLAKDEYGDNGHFPRQVYVREGRRIEGDHLFTAHDALPIQPHGRPPIYVDSITASHYSLDSHAVRKREPGRVHLDGFFSYPTAPYTVPYGVIVPKNVEGLLIPVPVSGTHVGFSTLRMEPCWMALGEAAGVAASLSVRDQVTPRKIRIADLQEKLLAHGAVLIYFQDVKPGHPVWPVLQKLALRGFFPGWQAQLKRPVTVQRAGQLAQALGKMAPPVVEGKTTLGEVLVALAEGQSNWPHWRGPHDCGSIETGRYPVKWDATTNVAWKTPLPGKGCSTPVVCAGRIFLTAPVEGKDAVLALDTSGKVLWQTTLGPERPGKHRNGSGCNPSPVTDGQGVFAYFKSGTLAGLDLDGRLRWKTNLQQEYGKDTLYWDIGTSPVLTEKDVVVAVMHEGDSFLAAFDKLTGQMRWKVARNYRTPLEGDHSYTTPILIRHEGREALLVLGGERLTAHDAADGKILWSCGDFNPQAKNNWVPVASPVVVGDIAVVPYGRGTCLHGIRLGGSGDVTASHRIWKREDTGSFVPTPAAQGGRVYVLCDRGEIDCIDSATGKTLWSGQLPKRSSKYYASPLVADGKIYAAREDGVVFVARGEGKFEVLAENDLGERLIASPVPLDGRLLLRGEKHLFCIAQNPSAK
jgi:outer membrane protein assembly factor BamB